MVFETISGYFPNPAIPPYNIRTLHFGSADSAGNTKVCDVKAAAAIIMETLLHRHTFLVGPPPAR